MASMAEIDRICRQNEKDYNESLITRDEIFKEKLQKNEFENDKDLLSVKLEYFNKFTDAIMSLSSSIASQKSTIVINQKPSIIINFSENVQFSPAEMASFIKEISN